MRRILDEWFVSGHDFSRVDRSQHKLGLHPCENNAPGLKQCPFSLLAARLNKLLKNSILVAF
jgi:hypothetical protein